MIEAGKLTKLFIVERQEEDLGLGIKRNWQPTGAKAWFVVEMLSGQELVAAQHIEARANYKLSTHWQPDFRPGDRLVAKATGQTFNIVSVNNRREMNRELELVCIEVVPS